MDAQGVLSTGNLVVDILVRPVEDVPWGRTAMVDAVEQHPGGNGCNTAYTLAMLGTPVRLLGAIGDDPFGAFVSSRLTAAGVDISGLCRLDAPTATTVVMVHRDGRRGFLHRLGASGVMTIDPDAFDRELEGGFAHYHVASPFVVPKLRAVQPELLRRARAAGLSTSVDTQWDSQGRWLEDLGPCLPLTDFLFANEDEAAKLSGSSDPAASARFFRQLGAGTVVLKLGSRGCAVFSDGVEFASPAFAVEAVDTTGAGDCFVGAFLSELLRGETVEKCARFANGVAAMAVRRLGATAGIERRGRTEEWIRAAKRAHETPTG